MPTYKNLIINGKIVNLVNGKSPKDITINGETYTPEQSGPVVGGRYKHLVYLAIGYQFDKSGTRPVYTKERAITMRLTFYSDSADAITSISEIPAGEYPRVDAEGDLKQYMLASDNSTSSYGYIYESSATSSKNYQILNNLVIEDRDNHKYFTFTRGSSNVAVEGYADAVYTISPSGWNPTPNLQTIIGLPSAQGSNYSWWNGIRSDNVTDTQS